MAINSINTNAAAIEGLAALNTASKQVVDSQQQISTGLKVASAKDDDIDRVAETVWAVGDAPRTCRPDHPPS